MIDPMEKITEGKDLVGKIQNFVSGFLGYYDRERRREADKILRDSIAARYETEWSRISDVQASLVKAKQLERLMKSNPRRSSSGHLSTESEARRGATPDSSMQFGSRRTNCSESTLMISRCWRTATGFERR